MTQDPTNQNAIALLATGDEITNGDILNTNSQVIAQKLFKNGMHIGIHMSAPDNINEIEQCITYLLKTHHALIITGGLGPTSDDITRYALSKSLNRPLLFHDAVWEEICNRFKLLGYTGIPPEGNRQQALFPEHATIIPNPDGTAAGCIAQEKGYFIFMLPGPPAECLPMIDAVVLPTLKKANFQQIQFYDRWLLFGVSEGQIAEELDAIAKPFKCTTGYRLFYPYIEFKLYSNDQHDFYALVALIEKAVAPYIISANKQTASEQLKQKLSSLNFVLSIQDLATGGLLENSLLTPETYPHLNFATHVDPIVEIKGLEEFWLTKESKETSIEIRFSNGQSSKKHIPFRGSRVKQYAVEYICQQIYLFLTTNDTN